MLQKEKNVEVENQKLKNKKMSKYNLIDIYEEYQIGSGWTNDFDYDGMLQAGLKAGVDTDIEVLNPVLRGELIKEYQEADILFLHVDDYKAFYKVLPSKIFEYAATGKPILAGVSGYAAKFLRNQVLGVEVFNPCDVEAMKAGLQKLLSGPKEIDRKIFCTTYNRKKIMKKIARNILSI